MRGAGLQRGAGAQEEGSGSLPGCRSAAAQSRPRGRHLGNSLRGQRRWQHRYGAPRGTGRARGARSAAVGRGAAPGAGFSLSAAGSGQAMGQLCFPPALWNSHLRSSPRGAAFLPRRGRDGGAAGAAAPSLPPWRSCEALPAAARCGSCRPCRCSFPQCWQTGEKENVTAQEEIVSLSRCQLRQPCWPQVQCRGWSDRGRIQGGGRCERPLRPPLGACMEE